MSLAKIRTFSEIGGPKSIIVTFRKRVRLKSALKHQTHAKVLLPE